MTHKDLRRGIIYKRTHKQDQILIVRERRTVNWIDSIVLVLLALLMSYYRLDPARYRGLFSLVISFQEVTCSGTRIKKNNLIRLVKFTTSLGIPVRLKL